jgi:hypothetical protein
MKRKKPSFNEGYHGYRTFSELLEDAQKEGLLELETDKRSGTYVVKRFGSELEQAPPAESAPTKSGGRKRRRSSRRRGSSGQRNHADKSAVKDAAEEPAASVESEPDNGPDNGAEEPPSQEIPF